MFNVGFKDLIEKCEEYFGKRTTKFGVAVIGLAVLTFVVGFAVSSSVYPLALWIGGVLTGNPTAGQAVSGIAVAATIFWVVVMLGLIVTVFQFRYEVFTAIDQRDRVGRALGNVEKFQKGLRDVLRKHPEEAGPHVLKLLDELDEEDEKANAKAAPRKKLLSALEPKDDFQDKT